MSTPIVIGDATIHTGDALGVLRSLPDASVQMCVTSPPYWGLRDYGVEGQLGLERTPEEYVDHMVAVFAEVRRVLRADGTLWLNIGDSYCGARAGSQGQSGQCADRSAAAQRIREVGITRLAPGLKPKDLVGIPWRLAFALQADGWWLRSDIVWAKPNPMPESVRDRPTRAHEYVFLFAKSETYFYDADAVAEPSTWNGQNRTSRVPEPSAMPGAPPHRGLRLDEPTGTRNRRSVWTIAPEPFSGAHFATFPTALVDPCILAGSRPGDLVLDPFNGAGTTGVVALKHGRRYVGIELNPAYVEMSARRLREATAQGDLFRRPA